MTNETKEQLENPDCQMATKGYVKKVARKILDKSEHNHKIKVEGGAGKLGIRGSLVYWSFITLAISLMVTFVSSVQGNHEFFSIAAPVAIMSGVIFMASMFCSDYVVTEESIVEYYPKSLCKWEPKEKKCTEDELKLPSKP